MTTGRNTSTIAGVEPRVFLSYARADGEQFAAELRQRLEAEHIPLWHDRIGMEGGKDWWQQITEALDVVEFMVLLMTPAAMRSETVRKEWRYARQQGVCVYPVKGVPDIDYEWQKLVNDLNTRCQQARVPFMVEDLPTDYVPRPQEFESLVEKLLDQQREEPVAITAALPALHAQLLDAYALKRWADLPEDEPYLWDHLAGHLVATDRLAELVTTVKDLQYLARKTLARTAFATEADLAFAEQQVPSDVPLRLLTRNFANMGHLLNRCTTYNNLAPVLYSRLLHLQELSDLCQAFEQDIPRPYLASWHLLPDLPDTALIRTLSGHTSWVLGCTFSPAEDTIVSASDDHTLKIWNAHTGEETRTLHGHKYAVNGCAISPGGDFIVSASDDWTLKVWGAHTGEVRRTLSGHSDWVNRCAISPEGNYIVSASKDQTIKVWDVQTGGCLSTLYVNGQPDDCAVHPNGEHIVAVGSGGVYFLRWVR